MLTDRTPVGFSFVTAVAVGLVVALLSGTRAADAPIAPAASSSASGGASSSELQAALIPRDVLFGNPDKASVRISPDGRWLSFLAPVDGVLNVWVGPADDPGAAHPVTEDKDRGIRTYFWAYDGKHLLYLQDKDGDEDFHVYAVDVAARKTRDLTPLEGVRARIQEVSHEHPESVLAGLNDRDPRLHDLYRIDLASGERKLIQKNEGFASFVTDDDFRVRFAIRMTPDGGEEILEPDDGDEWKMFTKIGMADTLTTGPAGFDKTGRILYMLDSRGRNTGAFTKIDLDTGQTELVAEDPRADLSKLMIHPTEKTVQAAAFDYLRESWKILDPGVERDFDVLRKACQGDIQITSRTLDDRYWIVAFIKDDGPVRYYRYDRPQQEVEFLFTNREDLDEAPLVKVYPVVIKSRDGLDLVSYLSLPPGTDPDEDGRPTHPLPLVLEVHGGPWARDRWGYDAGSQWLANRGYATLRVNYRGSTGFGKGFTNAGNKQWAAEMHNDLIDAVQWAVKERIADPDRVAIFGGSYGGYATLVGLTFTPTTFTCGVDIVGPSNLLTLLNSIPPYWAPMVELFTKRVGDHRTEEGQALLKSRSPLTYVDRIQRPLLIGQGANDPRVKQAESDQIVQAMQKKEIPVTYVLYSDEGHGFARPENRLSFYAVAEAFLAKCLGGRFEPIGDAFRGSSIEVPVGAGQVPGLGDALESKSTDE